MNILTLSGNLTKDAELRYVNDGKAVAGFTLANNQGFGDKQHTEYYDCSLWGVRAEKITQYLTKGTKVVVTGEHRTDKREYQGKEYFNNRIFIKEIEFAGGGNNSQSGGGGGSDYNQAPPQQNRQQNQQQQAPQQQAAQQAPSAPQAPASDFDDDIPF